MFLTPTAGNKYAGDVNAADINAEVTSASQRYATIETLLCKILLSPLSQLTSPSSPYFFQLQLKQSSCSNSRSLPSPQLSGLSRYHLSALCGRWLFDYSINITVNNTLHQAAASSNVSSSNHFSNNNNHMHRYLSRRQYVCSTQGLGSMSAIVD